MQEYGLPSSLSNQSYNWENLWQTKTEHDSDTISQNVTLLPLAERKHFFKDQGQRMSLNKS